GRGGGARRRKRQRPPRACFVVQKGKGLARVGRAEAGHGGKGGGGPPLRLSSHSLSLSFSWPHRVLECLRGCAAGPRAARPRPACCEAPTPSRLPDLTLPAVGPVPIAQGVPVIGAVIALSRLTHVAAIAGGCRGGLGGR